jgi:hypothetical protein
VIRGLWEGFGALQASGFRESRDKQSRRPGAAAHQHARVPTQLAARLEALTTSDATGQLSRIDNGGAMTGGVEGQAVVGRGAGEPAVHGVVDASREEEAGVQGVVGVHEEEAVRAQGVVGANGEEEVVAHGAVGDNGDEGADTATASRGCSRAESVAWSTTSAEGSQHDSEDGAELRQGEAATGPGPEAARTASRSRGGVCPRLQGKVRLGSRTVRVSFLVDSGASHNFISRAVAELIGAKVVLSGPRALRTAGADTVPCDGVTSGAQVTMAMATGGEWGADITFVVADIPDTDVILGARFMQDHKVGWRYEATPGGAITDVVVQDDAGRAVQLPVLGGGKLWSAQGMMARDLRFVAPGRKRLRKLQRQGEVMRVHLCDDDAASGADTDVGKDDSGEHEDKARAANDSGTVDQGQPGAVLRPDAKFGIGHAVEAARSDPTAYEGAPGLTEALVREFAPVFDAPTGIHRRDIEHRIEVEGRRVPPTRRVARFSLAELDAIRAWLKEMLANGWISPCMATHGAPLVLVRKHDGSFRVCQDFRALNSVTQPSCAPMPLFENMTATMVHSRVFSSLDLSAFYYQVAVVPEHRHLTAFATPFGHFKFHVTPMGVTGAPATACMLLGELLREFIGVSVATFIDDICIFTRSWEEHEDTLRKVLKILQDNHLKVALKKCVFGRKELKFLGHIIGRDGIKCDPARCAAIADWPVPKDVPAVRSFLGIAGYYRKFVPDFSLLSVPLNALLTQASPFRRDPQGAWGPEQQASFDKIKAALTAPPVLRIFDAARETVVRTDASEWGAGCVLYQRGDDNELHPVEYRSKRFSPAQMRYAPHDREFLAVLYAFKVWRHMLLCHPFLLETDNSALSQIKQSREISSKYARWLDTFEEMACTVRHRPGRKMLLEDLLSRPPPGLAEVDQEQFDPDEQLQLFRLHAGSGALACGSPRSPRERDGGGGTQDGAAESARMRRGVQTSRDHLQSLGGITADLWHRPWQVTSSREALTAEMYRTEAVYEQRARWESSSDASWDDDEEKAVESTHEVHAEPTWKGRTRSSSRGRATTAAEGAEKGAGAAAEEGTEASAGGAGMDARAPKRDLVPAGGAREGGAAGGAKEDGTGDSEEATGVHEGVQAPAGGAEEGAGAEAGRDEEGAAERQSRRRLADSGHHAGVVRSDTGVALTCTHPSMPQWGKWFAESEEWRHRWADGAGNEDLGFVVFHGLLFRVDRVAGWRLCVPHQARVDYLREIHDGGAAGHRGQRSTLQRARVLFWDSIGRDVRTFVQTCAACQRAKILRAREAGEAKSLPVPDRPWATFGMDWVGPLPRTARGFDTILNVVCHLTGMVHFIACCGTDTAAVTADRIMEGVVRLHGLPSAIVSDRDSKLTSNFWRSLCGRLGTKMAMSTAFHPQTDGKVERANATMEEVLRCYVSARMDDWDVHLASAELAVNTSVHDSTGFSPFFATYGYEARLPWHAVEPEVHNDEAEAHVDALQSVHIFCRDALRRAKDQQRNWLQQRRRVVVYEVGDCVLLATKHLKVKTPSFKLTSRFIGPFSITEVGSNTVTLQLPKHIQIHPTVNVAAVRPYYHRPEGLGGEAGAAVVEVDGETQYLVETILARRGKGNKRMYLVKWEGCDYSECTWEPADALPPWQVSVYENRWPSQLAHPDDDLVETTTGDGGTEHGEQEGHREQGPGKWRGRDRPKTGAGGAQNRGGQRRKRDGEPAAEGKGRG